MIIWEVSHPEPPQSWQPIYAPAPGEAAKAFVAAHCSSRGSYAWDVLVRLPEHEADPDAVAKFGLQPGAPITVRVEREVVYRATLPQLVGGEV